jgi:hypothetical protein
MVKIGVFINFRFLVLLHYCVAGLFDDCFNAPSVNLRVAPSFKLQSRNSSLLTPVEIFEEDSNMRKLRHHRNLRGKGGQPGPAPSLQSFET